MNLDDLSDFVLVASNGGFAQASRTSGRPKASLSRKVMDLEASLGVRLFERGSRSVHLTHEGELLFKRTGVAPLARTDYCSAKGVRNETKKRGVSARISSANGGVSPSWT